MSRFSFILIIVLWSFGVLAQSYCVKKNFAKLRIQPKTKAVVSWKVPQYMPLSGTGKKQGIWVEVSDVDGQIHWANKNDLSTRLNCLVVKTNTTKLRTGPGKSFELANIGVADKYSSFLDKGGEDGWTEVVDDAGEKAWVNLDHIWKPAAKKLRMSFDPDK